MPDLSIQESPNLLTHEERAILTRAMRVELHYHVRVDKQSQERPWVLEIDAGPLVTLAESAALGHRLYEFMHLQRPGDLLRYWWLREVDFGPELAEHVRKRVSFTDRHLFGTVKAPLAIPFVSFDACFWRQESGRINDDMNELEQLWYSYRQNNLRPPELASMFECVRAAQARLRSNPERLLQHELALIDSRTHRRDYWAKPEPVRFQSTLPRSASSLDADLFELIVSLAQREDVRRVSCPFDDRPLWRALVSEQVRRAKQEGVAPPAALFLAGPDGGLTHVEAQDWGGDIHIPWEGACDGDLFVKPNWHAFHLDRALAAGTVRAGLSGKAHRYAIVEGDLGEFVNDQRVRCGKWTLYRIGRHTGQGD